MPNPIDIARGVLLEPTGLQDRDLERILDQLMCSSIDAADIYFQAGRIESWVLEDGIIKEGAYNIEQGAGIRAVCGEKTGFAYTDDLQLSALLEAGNTARAIARAGEQRRIQIRSTSSTNNLYAPRFTRYSGYCQSGSRP